MRMCQVIQRYKYGSFDELTIALYEVYRLLMLLQVQKHSWKKDISKSRDIILVTNNHFGSLAQTKISQIILGSKSSSEFARAGRRRRHD